MIAARDARARARLADRDATAADVVAALAVEPPPADEDLVVSVHEAGHAVAALALGIEVVSVDLRTGRTTYKPREPVYAERQVAVARTSLAGIAAEQVLFGAFGCGGTADTAKATRVVAEMLLQMGHGTLAFHDLSQPVPDRLAIMVEARLRVLYDETLALVRARRFQVSRLAGVLRRERFLEGDAVAVATRFDKAAFFRSEVEAAEILWDERVAA